MRIGLTSHCVERYVARVKNHLTLPQAEAELRRLVAMAGEPQADHPWPIRDWERTPEDADAWLVICEGIALPLMKRPGGFTATSCLTRAGLAEGARAYRNARNGRRRHHRAMRRKKFHDRKEAKRTKRGVISDNREAA